MNYNLLPPIPFNKPFIVGNELKYIQEAFQKNKLSGDGFFSKKCQRWLEEHISCQKALLTHSCTAALEMAAILLDIQPGDEIIMPSYTFVSTANAFVLRGGVPVFIDIRPDTLNLDETKIISAITSKTKAIAVVHYAGVACEMESILAIAKQHNLYVIEDAAQALMAYYQGKPLGSFGHLATLSFHDTKNIISGEGGALLINDPRLNERAEIIREKGTNRSRFLRGEIDKYTWIDIGSSFLPSELTAAFLYAQLEVTEIIQQKRLSIWSAYHQALEKLEAQHTLRRPVIPIHCQHNAHLYYLLLPTQEIQAHYMTSLKAHGISAASHYVPLHHSPAGKQFGRYEGKLAVTEHIAECLLRLPLWVGLEESDVQRIVEVVTYTLLTQSN